MQIAVALPVVLAVGGPGPRSWMLLVSFGLVAGAVGRALDLSSALGLATSGCAILVLLVGAPGGSFSIGGTTVGFLFSVAVVLALVLLRSIGGASDDLSVVAPSALMLSALVLPTLDATAVSGLSRVVGNFGEDNGAWLIALARSTDGAATVLTEASGNHGGPATGLVLAMVRNVIGLLRPSDVVGLESNGLVLYRAYIVVSVLAALVSSATAARMTRDRGRLVASTSGLASAAVVFCFAMGLVTVGHFSALVAVLCGLTAVRMLLTDRSDAGRVPAIGACAACMVAVGQSWFPLTGVGILFVLLLVVRWVVVAARSLDRSRLWSRLFPVLVGVVVAAWILYSYVLDTYLQNVVDFSYILDNLRLAGGYPNLRLEVGFVLLLVGAWVVFGPTGSMPGGPYVPLAVASFLAPLIFLLVITFAVSPHAPQYGLYKYLYIYSAIVVPSGVALVVSTCALRFDRSVLPAAPLIGALGFLLLAPPGDKIGWTDSSRATRNDWAAAVVGEIGSDPSRVVGCLNTIRGDTDNDYKAYFCSRIAFGLAGRDSLPDLVWTAANICSSPASQVASDIPRSYFGNLTVVVFDGRRRSSGAGCQSRGVDGPTGWTSTVDWDMVKLVDLGGRRVDPLVP